MTSITKCVTCPLKSELGCMVFMCLCSSRPALRLYMTVYSIHSTARHADLCLSLQAGHRGCQIRRALLKYSIPVRDLTRVLMLSVYAWKVEKKVIL